MLPLETFIFISHINGYIFVKVTSEKPRLGGGGKVCRKNALESFEDSIRVRMLSIARRSLKKINSCSQPIVQNGIFLRRRSIFRVIVLVPYKWLRMFVSVQW